LNKGLVNKDVNGLSRSLTLVNFAPENLYPDSQVEEGYQLGNKTELMDITPSRKLAVAARLLSLFSLFLVLSISASAQDLDNGEAIYKAKCATCHNLDASLNAAPGFEGVMERWAGNEEMMYTWINNPNKAIASGNDYVTSMVNKWKPKFGLMAGQNLTNDEIDMLLELAPLQPIMYTTMALKREKVFLQSGGSLSSCSSLL